MKKVNQLVNKVKYKVADIKNEQEEKHLAMIDEYSQLIKKEFYLMWNTMHH